MNKTQINYFYDSFLLYGVCSNSDCPIGLSPYSTREFTRCPICDEPSLLPTALSPLVGNLKSEKNIYESYYSKLVSDLFLQLKGGEIIGRTTLAMNRIVAQWSGVKELWLKNETDNPSGSFKDRGSFSAIALLLSKFSQMRNTMIMGTVSTGNMAISTAFMVDYLNSVNPDLHLQSFIVVGASTSKKKLLAIQQAASKTGTKLFVVSGEYSRFHEVVYRACADLRSNGVSIHAQLTDDVFRISGYGTLFAEIIEQMLQKGKVPDYIVLPVASGALFRVAIWSLERLYQHGVIQKIPRVILVQEQGGDPIVQAMIHGQEKVTPITLSKKLVADAINVSQSRSGNPSLRVLHDGFHLSVSVSTQDILMAQEQLHRQGIFVEPASAASVAAGKHLQAQGIILEKDVVVCVLTGKQVEKRVFADGRGVSEVITCRLEEFQEVFMKTYVN